MAKRGTHLVVGGATGVAAAAYAARNQDPWNFVAEVIGGGVGGALGSLAPDVLEPAIHSWHRSLAHSCATGVAGAVVAQRHVSSWQQRCRAEAQRHEQLRLASNDEWARCWHALMAFIWRALSGFAVGAPAGYVSHLVLDAGTPRSLPLLA